MMLQRVRNKLRLKKNQGEANGSVIAKVDASTIRKIKVTGPFWMIPMIAKVDALKVYISEIPDIYQ